MNISVFELTVPQFILSLNGLKDILRKGQAYADGRKIEMSVLLQSRLAPDQFPLGKQVQIACDTAKSCAARLAGLTAPTFEDSEKTVEEFLDRIDRSVEYLREFKPEQFQGYEKRKISFPWSPGHFLDGHNYLVQHAIPNFYFHLATAYSILRFNGVDLGKKDFLGDQNWKTE